MREIEYQNYIFYIGHNAKENWELLDKLSKINNEYIWFHLNSFPSPYVIVNTTLTDLSKNSDKNELLLFGSQLCKDYSKYKFLSNLKIIYTSLKKLKKTDKTGEVIITGKKNIISL